MIFASDFRRLADRYAAGIGQDTDNNIFGPLIPPRFAFVVTFSAFVVVTIVRGAPEVTITGLSIMSYLFGIILIGNVDELFIVTALNLITVVFPIVLCTHINLLIII